MTRLKVRSGGVAEYADSPSLTFSAIGGTLSDAQHGSRGGGSLHPAATPSVAGFLSATDKAKLDAYPAITGLTPGHVLQALTATSVGFAALVASQIPDLDAAKITTGLLPVARGGTGVGAIPAFSVHKNGTNQTPTANSWVKVTWSTEDFDTNNNFASSRFTPTVAGRYTLSCTLQYNPDAGNPIANGVRMIISVWKNGVEAKRSEATSSGNNYYYPQITTTLTANGTTDYFEIYTYTVSGATNITIGGNAEYTHWSGFWVAP
jgi:hypothetical protein